MTESGLDRDVALAAVDEALETGRVSAEDRAARELQDLALAIEAESELPHDDFARELEELVAAGFPRPRRRLPTPPRLPSLPRRRVLALAGAAATLLLVVGIALTTARDDTFTRGDVALQADPQSRPEPVADGSAEVAPPPDIVMPNALATGEPPAESQAKVAPGARERRIERSAELTLAAPDGELDSVADSIVRVTDRHRGFVLRSSVSTGDDSERGGSFDLRIPADSLRTALGDLSKLGHVRARRQAGRDVTPAYVSASDRLDAARAERTSLLRRLAAADTDADAERLRARLARVSLRLERLRREIAALRERTNYSAVTVDLEASDGDGGAATGGTREALDDSLGLLSDAFNLLVRALGLLLPLAIVGGLAWLTGRVLRRRRREAALR